MAAPGWPKADTIPEASVVQIDADGSHHGSHHGSRHGSHHGSAHGGSSYVQALQVSRDAGNAAKLERRASRRLENAVLGVNDWDQDYTDDYPKERDDQAAVDEKTKTHDYNPGQIIIAYFKKWKGGMDEVGACFGRHSSWPCGICLVYNQHGVCHAGHACSSHP